MAKVDITSLRRGDQFIGPDGTRYEVTAPASEHHGGYVDVRNLSMTDEEAAERARVNQVDDGRAGFFSLAQPVQVERVEA